MDYRARLASILADDGQWVPPQPRPAATMVLRRHGRVLLLRRSPTMAFAPNVHVFPGGGLDDVDSQAPDPITACAIRETFEEVSIRVEECRLIDRWITPELEERRYDVWFFLAETDHPGELSTTEADKMHWLDPAQALELHGRGELAMLRPTVALLEGLIEGRYDDSVDVVAKLPRLRADGSWDVIDADTGKVLAAGVPGPKQAETDGMQLP